MGMAGERDPAQKRSVKVNPGRPMLALADCMRAFHFRPPGPMT